MSSALPRDYVKATAFLRIAEILGELSTCDRSDVGAVIVRDGRCISWGFNGAPPGFPHCEESRHGWWKSPDTVPYIPDEAHLTLRTEQFEAQDWGWEEGAKTAVEQFGCRNVTHAEANAVAFAARQGISTEGATLYVTLSPCEVCARLLVAAGIVKVVFTKQYRKDEGILLLKAAGVTVVG